MATILVANGGGALSEPLRELFAPDNTSASLCGSKTDAEIVEETGRLNPALVILDMMMDPENLSRLTKHMRKLVPQVVIFMLAEHYDFDVEQLAFSCGVNAVFSRDEDPIALLANAQAACGN
jgi:DNA-binding NarL/FixJ family response regulator